MNQKLTYVEYANGASFDTAAVGSYLVTIEQPLGSYKFLGAYIDLLCGFFMVCFYYLKNLKSYYCTEIK